MGITLFVETFCGGCIAAKRWVAQYASDVDVQVVDVTRDEGARVALTELGLATLPVLVTPAGAVAGYNPERYGELIGAVRDETMGDRRQEVE